MNKFTFAAIFFIVTFNTIGFCTTEIIVEDEYLYEIHTTNIDMPASIALDSNENLYVGNDGTTNQIYKVSSINHEVNYFGPTLHDPDSVTIDSQYNIYIGNDGQGLQIVKQDNTSSQFTSSYMYNITALIVDKLGIFEKSGFIYVANSIASTSNHIVRVSPNGESEVFLKNSPILHAAHGLAFDNTSYLYAASSGSHKVFRISSDASIETFIELSSPESIAFNQTDGNLYVGDIVDNKVYKVNLSGNVTVFAENIKPYGIAIDNSGNLFITDRIVSPHRIIKIFKKSTPCEGLYTQEQVYEMISKILTWGDINKDNKIGLEEAIRALIIASGANK